jgi:hypothetical protein
VVKTSTLYKSVCLAGAISRRNGIDVLGPGGGLFDEDVFRYDMKSG